MLCLHTGCRNQTETLQGQSFFKVSSYIFQFNQDGPLGTIILLFFYHVNQEVPKSQSFLQKIYHGFLIQVSMVPQGPSFFQFFIINTFNSIIHDLLGIIIILFFINHIYAYGRRVAQTQGRPLAIFAFGHSRVCTCLTLRSAPNLSIH